jgi:hypothetical protein
MGDLNCASRDDALGPEFLSANDRPEMKRAGAVLLKSSEL